MVVLMEERRPRRIKLDNRELPPYETNGKVTPTIGRIPIFMPTFMKNWIRIRKKAPMQKALRNLSSEKRKILYIL